MKVQSNCRFFSKKVYLVGFFICNWLLWCFWDGFGWFWDEGRKGRGCYGGCVIRG